MEEKDVTAIARNVVEAVQRKPLVLTLNQLIQTFRGSSAGSKHRQRTHSVHPCVSVDGARFALLT